MENPKTATERTGAGGRERSIILLLNGSERVIRIITFLNLCFMFILNHFTLLIGDDYTYCFSFASGRDRITSPIQILPSMAAHYGNMNGRLIVHGISQLMLMLPPGLFDVLNAGVFCLLCVIIYDYIWKLNHETHLHGVRYHRRYLQAFPESLITICYPIVSLSLLCPCLHNDFLFGKILVYSGVAYNPAKDFLVSLLCLYLQSGHFLPSIDSHVTIVMNNH